MFIAASAWLWGEDPARGPCDSPAAAGTLRGMRRVGGADQLVSDGAVHTGRPPPRTSLDYYRRWRLSGQARCPGRASRMPGQIEHSGGGGMLVQTVTWTILLSVVLHGISAPPLAARYGTSIEKAGKIPEKARPVSPGSGFTTLRDVMASEDRRHEKRPRLPLVSPQAWGPLEQSQRQRLGCRSLLLNQPAVDGVLRWRVEVYCAIEPSRQAGASADEPRTGMPLAMDRPEFPEAPDSPGAIHIRRLRVGGEARPGAVTGRCRDVDHRLRACVTGAASVIRVRVARSAWPGRRPA